MLTVPLAVSGALAGLYMATVGVRDARIVGDAGQPEHFQPDRDDDPDRPWRPRTASWSWSSPTSCARGASRSIEAIREAARSRLRPILMTGISTALGALPLVLGSGPGSGGRRAIGVVVFAGVLTATFLTLFVVPVAYSILARRTSVPGERERQLDALETLSERPGRSRPELSRSGRGRHGSPQSSSSMVAWMRIAISLSPPSRAGAAASASKACIRAMRGPGA